VARRTATLNAQGSGDLADVGDAPSFESAGEVARVIAVGIDIAKRTHEACFMGQDGRQIGKARRFANTRPGLRALLQDLQQLPEPVTIGLEATGHYWLALHDELARAGHTVQVLNPLQTHAYRKTTIRKVKSDRKDAWLIADVVRIGRGRAAYVPDETILQLRELTRFRWTLVDQVGDAKRRILTILDRVFPEYETLFSDVFIKSSRALLERATTAAEFADANVDELTAVLKHKSRGRLGADKAEAVQMAARDSLGMTRLGGVASFELRALLDQITFLEQQVAAVEQQIETLLATIEQHLTDIKGISPIMAASLIAEIGDVQRFRRFESLVAYTGIDPSVFASGEFKATETHMSKRGSPHLRRALWLSAITASQSNPDLAEYLQRRLDEGKPWGTVMGAVARKLLSRIYVVLKQNRPYQVR
jgi:transposase